MSKEAATMQLKSLNREINTTSHQLNMGSTQTRAKS